MVEASPVTRFAPGSQGEVVMCDPDLLPSPPPPVSCIMATRGRLKPARHAIHCFQNQTHPARELVVACAETGSEVEAHVATLGDPRIRFVDARGADTVGDIRNRAIAEAGSELIAVWDDDDLSHPRRLAWQVAALAGTDTQACFLAHVLLWWPARGRLAISGRRIWENTMVARRAATPPYPSQRRGGDTLLARDLRAAHATCAIGRPAGYCYVAHEANLWDAKHFDMLFANALTGYQGADYARLLEELSADLPVRAYAADGAGA